MYCPNCGQQQSDDTKFCSNCGADLQTVKQEPNPTPPPAAVNQNPAPQPVQQPIQQPIQQPAQPKPKKPWYKKWWIWVIVGVLVVGGIGGAFAEKTDGTKKSGGSTSSAASSASSAAEKEKEKATTAPAKQNKATEAPKEEEPASYSVGDSYEVDGLVMTVDSSQKYESDNEYLQPKEGNYFLAVHITFQNNSKKDKPVGPSYFKCYVDDKAYDNTYFAGDDYLGYDDLSSGRSSSGTIYYELPVDAKNIELEYTPSYWSNNKRIIYTLN